MKALGTVGGQPVRLTQRIVESSIPAALETKSNREIAQRSRSNHSWEAALKTAIGEAKQSGEPIPS